MKKTIFAIIIMAISINLQAQVTEKGTHHISFTTDVINEAYLSLSWTSFPGPSNISYSLPITFNYMYAINNWLTVGAEINLSHASGTYIGGTNLYSISQNDFAIIANVDFHYLKHSQYHDLYQGIGIGYLNETRKVPFKDVNITSRQGLFDGRINFLGWRWMFSRHLGTILELSNYGKIGLTLKL